MLWQNYMRIIVLLSSCWFLGCEARLKPTGYTTDTLSSTACSAFEIAKRSFSSHKPDCYRLTVPLSKEQGDERTLELAIVKVASISPYAQPDPLFIIVGGPGQSALDFVSQLSWLFHDVRKNRDLIFIDQRGLGSSTPLLCQASTTGSFTQSLLQLQTEEVTRLTKCKNSYGDYLKHFTTRDTVQDIDAVRLAMGYPQINIWGVSYGTRVAMDYAHIYPAAVRTLMLDGVAPASIAIPNAMANTEVTIERYLSFCEQEPTCHKAFGRVNKKYQQLIQQLKHQSVSIVIEHPFTGVATPINLDADVFSAVLRSALYSRDLARLIPFVIFHAEQENYQPLARLAVMTFESSQESSLNELLHFAIICSEDFYNPNLELEGLPDYAVQTYSLCNNWPTKKLPKGFFDQQKLSVPTLTLSGYFDPVTPAQYAELVTKDNHDAVRLIAPGGHHGVSTEGCSKQVLAKFIATQGAYDSKFVCVENILPLPPYQAPAKELPDD